MFDRVLNVSVLWKKGKTSKLLQAMVSDSCNGKLTLGPTTENVFGQQWRQVKQSLSETVRS